MSEPQQAFKHIVHSFNARTMSWQHIVATFVPPADFPTLTAQSHTLVLGARGSGKTTLLKMVSKNALDLLEKEQKKDWMGKINFTGIYIPADAIWESMLSSIKKTVQDQNLAFKLMEAAFATNVCMAIVQTVHDCIAEQEKFRPLTMLQDEYLQAVKEVADLWDIEPVSFSFLSLKHSLSLRLLELQKITALLACGLLAEISVKEMLMTELPYLGKPVFKTIFRTLDIINTQSKNPDYTWALLFDEFEIVPTEILQQLLEQMRGGGDNQHVLFKVSLAPCGILSSLNISEKRDPSLMHDYQQITLWYTDKNKARKFCESICIRYLNQHENCLFHGKSPREVFGDSPYFNDNENEEDATNNEETKKKVNYHKILWKKDFEELQSKDVSFATFLNHRGIDLSSLDKSSSQVRKIAPLVLFRNAFLKKDGDVMTWRKPNKKPYSGWLAIADICDGNPRWLMSILEEMMSKVKPSNVKSCKIPNNIQQDMLYRFSYIFHSILKNIPTKQSDDSLDIQRPINELLEKLGKYFHNQLITKKFSENPTLDFTVDSKIDKEIENSLRIAINHGALICLNEPDCFGGYKTLIGKDMRISYLLAPYFKLIPRRGNSVQISTIIDYSGEKQKVKSRKNRILDKKNSEISKDECSSKCCKLKNGIRVDDNGNILLDI